MKTNIAFTAFAAFGLSIAFSGCGIPEPSQISPGVYSIYKQDTAGIFGNSHKMRGDVVSKANSFAAARGMIAVPVEDSFKPMGGGPGQFAAFDYKFYLSTPSEYAEMQAKNKRDWDTLTPAQRLAHNQREAELSQKAQALALSQQSINQAANAQYQDANLRRQEVNAYQQRTDVYNQPVNVNVRGTINHNVNGAGVIPPIY